MPAEAFVYTESRSWSEGEERRAQLVVRWQVTELSARLAETEDKYRDIVSRLQRLLDLERANLRRDVVEM